MLDVNSLDDQDPFELDGDNVPHLFKHGHYGTEDLFDIYMSDPIFFPARPGGGANWLMVGEVPGEPPLVVPLAPPRSGDPRKARPIGIYPATGTLLTEYFEAIGRADLRAGDRRVR